MFCSNCGKELDDKAVICVSCGRNVKKKENENKANTDRVSIGLCILCFFVPIVGIIYWAIMKDDSPRQARACGITALVSAALSIVFSLIATIFSTFFFALLLGA